MSLLRMPACSLCRPTEFWAAYIDPNTGWGLGVYNPMAWMGITAYRIGPDGADSRPWDCSYFAHTIRMQLHPGMKAYPYTVYITGVWSTHYPHAAAPWHVWLVQAISARLLLCRLFES